jgi:hypothetical protein
MNKSTSENDILRFIRPMNAKILEYPEIYNFKTIEELINPYGIVVLLYLIEENFGHWVCLFKSHNNKIEFFDPYGVFPDDELNFGSEVYKLNKKNVDRWLTRLLLNYMNNGNKVDYNEYQFQKFSKNIATCGRHCAFRIINKNISIDKYKKLMDELKKASGLSYDEIVTLLMH